MSSSPPLSFPSHPNPSSIGPLYILHFAVSHSSFRLPDFVSACEYLSIPFAFVSTPASDNYHQNVRLRAQQSATHSGTFSSSASSSACWKPDILRPFLLAHLPNDEAAVKLLQRCVSLRSIWAYWSNGATYSELYQRAQSDSSKTLWQKYQDPITCPSWKAYVFSYNSTIPDKRKLDIIQSFSFLEFRGDIQLKNPYLRWGVMEEHLSQDLWSRDSLVKNSQQQQQQQQERVVVQSQTQTSFSSDSITEPQLADKDSKLVQIFCGRRIDLPAPSSANSAGRKSSDPGQEGQFRLARDLIDRLDLKKRVYIGNTSMESEMSLLMASMVHAGPGRLIYDPFAGTGSLLYASAILGGYVFGSDIDGRTMRGKTKSRKNPKITSNDDSCSIKTGIVQSAEQYGIRDQIMDCVVCDMTQSPWRNQGFLDGIIADPPYGVRAGAKRLGKRDPEKQRSKPFWMPDGIEKGIGCWSHERSDYLPPTHPYHLKDLIQDLLDYSFRLLAPGGRLVFWLPEVIEEEQEEQEQAQEEQQHQTQEEQEQTQEEQEQTQEEQEKPSKRILHPPLPCHDSRTKGTGRMKLVCSSLQDFGRWGRWLITMVKVPAELDVEEEEEQHPMATTATATAARNTDQHGVFRADIDQSEFRNRYFSGFKSINTTSSCDQNQNPPL